MFIGATMLTVLVLAGLWVNHYLRNHCLQCKKRTNWGKYDRCGECNAKHEAWMKEHEEKQIERLTAMCKEMDKRADADHKEFGFSMYEFLDVPCAVCTDGTPKTHREIMRERGFSGDHKKCWDFIWNTHFPLSKKAHKERESRKFWKRWLYIPPSKEEAEAIGRITWQLQNILCEGRSELAPLREYHPYVESPDYWMHMSTSHLLKRRLGNLKKFFTEA